MKVVIQRVKKAKVTVDEQIVGQIDRGYVILVGVTESDSEEDVNVLVKKIPHLRVFEDDEQKMNLSLMDIHGSILSISQFTLYADTRKGRRPSFINAAHPDKAEALYNFFNQQLIHEEVKVEKGIFGAMMDIDLVNEGPVTIILETKEGKLV